MTDPKTQDPSRAERAMRKIKQLQADIAEYEEAVENLKDVVIANLPVGETTLGNPDDGYVKATVYQSKRFDEEYGKKQAPELWDQHAVTQRVLTSKAAKEKLEPEQYALFQKPSSKLSVVVEALNDEA
jgi:hypothetical protein